MLDLNLSIEFASQNSNAVGTSEATGDAGLLILMFLISIIIAAFGYFAYRIFEKNQASNMGNVKCQARNKIKLITLIVTITVFAISLFNIALVKAYAEETQKDAGKIVIYVNEEENTLSSDDFMFSNQTSSKLKFQQSMANINSTYSNIDFLKQAKLTLNSQKGYLFNGKLDGQQYTEIQSFPLFEQNDSIPTKINFDNLSIEDAKKLIGKESPIKVSFACEQKCIVTFDCQGFGTQPPSQEISIGDKVIKPENPTDATSAFLGWYKEADCVTAWDFDNDIVNQDTTLYAGWKNFAKEIQKQIIENPEYQSYIQNNNISIEMRLLDGTASYSYNSNKKMCSASMIKLLILAEFMDQVSNGKVKLSDIHVINETDKKTGGAGHINAFPLGTEVSLDDIAKYMIMYSDNAASNVLIDKLGKEQINTQASKLNLKNTVLGRKLIVEAPTIDKDNFTCAEDCTTILDAIYKNKIADAELSKKVQNEYLLNQTDKACLGKIFAENGIDFGHKTGNLTKNPQVPTTTDARHDAGIVYFGNKPFIISVTTELREGLGNPIHNKIAQIVVDTICAN